MRRGRKIREVRSQVQGRIQVFRTDLYEAGGRESSNLLRLSLTSNQPGTKYFGARRLDKVKHSLSARDLATLPPHQ